MQREAPVVGWCGSEACPGSHTGPFSFQSWHFSLWQDMHSNWCHCCVTLGCVHQEIPWHQSLLVNPFSKMQQPQMFLHQQSTNIIHCKTKENPFDLGQTYLNSLWFYQLASLQHQCIYFCVTSQHQKYTVLPKLQMGSRNRIHLLPGNKGRGEKLHGNQSRGTLPAWKWSLWEAFLWGGTLSTPRTTGKAWPHLHATAVDMRASFDLYMVLSW